MPGSIYKRASLSLASALVVAGGLLGVSAVGAKPPNTKPHKQHVDTTVIFDDYKVQHYPDGGSVQGFQFYGILQSTKAKCRKAGRRIDLVYVDAQPDKHLGFDLSDSNGGWSVLKKGASITAGTYLAQLKPKTFGNVVCSGDTGSFFIPNLRH